MANKKLWLVTNAHPIVLHIKMQKTGISHLFDQLISSHDLGFAKEQELFWHKLAAQYPFDKKRTIFIDDSESVLHAARHYGIEHVYGITQPDSKLPARQQLKFPAIDQLNELSKCLLSIQAEE
jgi:putative hydrolase of the HAD superfamily